MKISTIKSIWWHLTLVPVIALGLLLIAVVADFLWTFEEKPKPKQNVEVSSILMDYCKENMPHEYRNGLSAKTQELIIEQCYDDFFLKANIEYDKRYASHIKGCETQANGRIRTSFKGRQCKDGYINRRSTQ